MSETTKILLIEPSYLIREGLRSTISRLNIAFEVDEVEEMRDGFARLLEKYQPHIVFASHQSLAEKWTGNKSDAVFDQKTIVGLYSGKLSLAEKARYDEIICVDDNKRLITNNIQRILQQTGLLTTYGEAENLSEREREVLRLVALGLTNNEIADRLFISTFTVMTHRKNMTRKLGIKTVSGLTVYAILNKIIESGELQNI